MNSKDLKFKEITQNKNRIINYRNNKYKIKGVLL